MWRRYRFKTRSVDDYRPLIFDECHPWWCSGTNDETATIICWLPKDEDLLKFWNDAEDIEFTDHDQIEFTSRFQKPSYFKEKILK